VNQPPRPLEDSATVAAAPSPARRSTRLAAYLAERFPLLAHGVLILSFCSSNQFLAQALTDPGQPVHYDARSLLGFFTLLGFFLHLRIFDDHKDYRADCRHFPDRVLQRGVVSLDELKLVGGFAIGVEFILAALAGPAALIAVLMVFGFSVLMLKEFFVASWLRRHFLVNVVVHMLVMPLLALVVFSISTGRYPWQAPGWFWLYAWVGFFVAFNWEVSRKIRAPADEIADLDSYTKVFGTYGAAYLVLVIRVVDTGLVALVAHHLRFSAWFYVWLIALFLLCMVGFLQFRFRTSSATARRMETYAGLYIVAFDLALAVELARTCGISLRGAD
jgi:4-hydroxybenzoate polyprenyltransferase